MINPSRKAVFSTDTQNPYFDPDMQNKLIKNSVYRDIKLSVIYSLLMILISYLASAALITGLMLPPIFFPSFNNGVYIKIAEAVAYTAQMVLPTIFYIVLTRKTLGDLYYSGTFALPRQTCEKVTPCSILSYFFIAFSLSQIIASLGGILTFFVSFLGSLISPNLVLDNAAYDLPIPQNTAEFLLNFISVAILPAILEELLFRGAILGEFLKYGKTFAICISAFLFSSVHGSIDQMMYSFVFGLIFGYIAVKTGSLTTGIIIHFLNNAYSCVAEYLGIIYDTDIFWNILSVVNLAFVTTGLVLLIYKIIKNKLTYTEIHDSQKQPFELSEKEKFRIFLSPVMIFYYAYILFETLYVYFSYNITN